MWKPKFVKRWTGEIPNKKVTRALGGEGSQRYRKALDQMKKTKQFNDSMRPQWKKQEKKVNALIKSLPRKLKPYCNLLLKPAPPLKNKPNPVIKFFTLPTGSAERTTALKLVLLVGLNTPSSRVRNVVAHGLHMVNLGAEAAMEITIRTGGHGLSFRGTENSRNLVEADRQPTTEMEVGELVRSLFNVWEKRQDPERLDLDFQMLKGVMRSIEEGRLDAE